MEFRYQLGFIGNKHPLIPEIIKRLEYHLDELGVNKEFVSIVDQDELADEIKGNTPLLVVYFGDDQGNYKDVTLLKDLESRASLILPVVEELEKFNESVPEILRPIHGFELKSAQEIESLVSFILESFGLLRTSRRLFISYRKSDSELVAVQLFGELEKRGFEVYLDTHSNRKGDHFQEELWHRLADSDVMILLNTKDFLKGEWTQKELAQANAMKIGILQILWPDQKIDISAVINILMKLEIEDFGNETYTDAERYLSDEAVGRIAEQVEYLRARTLAARQGNIIAEFMGAVYRVGKQAVLHPERIIQMNNTNGEDILVIPAVGVPQAFTYHRSEDMVAELKLKGKPALWLLYDHVNIRDKWIRHLDWLDNHLPVKGIKVTNAETWLQDI